MTRDLALTAVAKWAYAYKYLDEKLKRDKGIILAASNHGNSGYGLVLKHHPEGEIVLTEAQNTVCEITLILFADSQDKTGDAVDKLRAAHQQLGCFTSDN